MHFNQFILSFQISLTWVLELDFFKYMNSLFRYLCSLLQIGILIPVVIYYVIHTTHNSKKEKKQDNREMFFKLARLTLFFHSQVKFVIFCNAHSD